MNQTVLGSMLFVLSLLVIGSTLFVIRPEFKELQRIEYRWKEVFRILYYAVVSYFLGYFFSLTNILTEHAAEVYSLERSMIFGGIYFL